MGGGYGLVFEGFSAEPGLAAAVTLTVHITTIPASFFTSSKSIFWRTKNPQSRVMKITDAGIFKTMWQVGSMVEQKQYLSFDVH